MHNWQATSAELGGIGRDLVFKLWRTGELGSVKIGKYRFSTDNQIQTYIERLEAAGGDPA